ncbi:MAG: hypothetical protein WC979_03045 [Candidatus Pacearchaeota archaeon]|jgi:hypothetical protein|nr:hypothetical protein [Clostridia bacterium]
MWAKLHVIFDRNSYHFGAYDKDAIIKELVPFIKKECDEAIRKYNNEEPIFEEKESYTLDDMRKAFNAGQSQKYRLKWGDEYEYEKAYKSFGDYMNTMHLKNKLTK